MKPKAARNRAVLEALRAGESQRSIARRLGISQPRVCAIRRRASKTLDETGR